MQLSTSYRQILTISAPIMLGSAAQNVIALADSIFLYFYDEVHGMGNGEFASIGFVSVFYLVVAAIGYGFSKGGQILIARKMGEDKPEKAGLTFYSMLYFEMALAVVMFLFMQFGAYYLFALIVDSDRIFYQSLDYLSTRSWGVFFSYAGVAFIALYTGIARTKFIIVATLILALVNIILNYCLIFGRFGFPEMGIAGAGLASTIAEICTFLAFVIYMLQDKQAKEMGLFKLPELDIPLIKKQMKLSTPIVAQSIVGLGSWFIFFGIVENLGERELAISNLVRMVYLMLSIPCWGFASGTNTLVSHFIGARKRQAVVPIIWKVAKVSLLSTLILALPVVLFPETTLYPILGSQDMSLITESRPILWVLFVILLLFSVVGVLFNGLAGTGATMFGLKLQLFCALFYLAYIYIVVEFTNGGLMLAWTAEIFYFIILGVVTIWYLHARKWWNLGL